MIAPKFAVVGSCMSRDPFNRSFAADYRSNAELVSDVYQSAVPSLIRQSKVDHDLPSQITEAYKNTLWREYLGNNMANILLSKPDILVLDFFADIHFGVTTIDNQYVTRNHMAFENSAEAETYYKDEKEIFPLRGRFEGVQESGEPSYAHLAIESLAYFNDRLKATLPDTRVVINSARFATQYRSKEGHIEQFSDPTKLAKKNQYWDELDVIAERITGAQRVVYPDKLILGDEMHKWGLNPVHYGQAYYDHFWEVTKTLSET